MEGTRASPAGRDTNCHAKEPQPPHCTPNLHHRNRTHKRRLHTDPNDPLPTPQLTNDNSLTGLQDAWKITQRLIHLRLRHRMRKLTTSLLTSTQIDIPIQIMHGVDMRTIVKTK